MVNCAIKSAVIVHATKTVQSNNNNNNDNNNNNNNNDLDSLKHFHFKTKQKQIFLWPLTPSAGCQKQTA